MHTQPHTPPIPNSTSSTQGPRWILHSASCVSCPAHRPESGAEAAARPEAGRGQPAAGSDPGDSPSRGAPEKAGDQPVRLRGAATPPAGCARSQRPAPLGIRVRLRTPRPGLALRSNAGPGGARWGGGCVADSWWGKLGKFAPSADWPARGGALSSELGPSCPSPH